MSKMNYVSALDIAGTPLLWMEPREAMHHHAACKVAWGLDTELAVFRGGISRKGVRSQLPTRLVIALAKNEVMVKWAREILPLKYDNRMLFKRDQYLCAYCGDPFGRRELTRKRNRTPEEATLPLHYVPYSPCRSEYFILSGRLILADQKAYLLARATRACT